MHDRIFLGIGGHVLALDPQTGKEYWRTSVGGTWSASGITGVTCLGGRLYATCQGELFCLDPGTGALQWKQPLSGLGTGFIALAGSEEQGPAASEAAAQVQATMVASAMAAVMLTSGGGSSS